MGRSNIQAAYVEGPLPVDELGNGSYTFYVVSEPFVVRPTDMEAFKQTFKEQIEAQDVEGRITVNKVTVTYEASTKSYSDSYIWVDGTMQNPSMPVDGAHTLLTVDFTITGVESPGVILTIIIIGLIFAAGVTVGLLLSGVLAPIMQMIAENPWVIPVGIGLGVLLLVVVLASDRK